MLIDLNVSLPDFNSLENFDTVIIGAGAAGITLADKLSSLGKKIALIEGGDQEYTNDSQEIYKANTVGDPYFELDVARLRFFGGSTNHWGGWCRSFDTIDFNRQYLGPEYKWPVVKSDIDQYLSDACNILEIPKSFKDVPLRGGDINEIEYQFSPPVNFNEKYLKNLKNNKNVTVILNSNLIDINGENRRVKFATFASYTGNKIDISSARYIFAMGGIENSRYLLWFQKKYSNKFFDSNLPVGEYWMEHPYFSIGKAIVDKRKIVKNFYSLRPQAQKELYILNCSFRFDYLHEQGTKALIRDALCVAPNLGKKLLKLANRNLVCGAILRASWEQAPIAKNRICLDTQLDKFKIPRSILYWKKNQIDRNTIKKSVDLLNEFLLETDAGRIQYDEWLLNNQEYPVGNELASWHHMGGTRMHSQPKFGVIDSNCKVYGSKNIWIAGSSIFTTGGHTPPTLPIVQFALRLAKHLTS